MQDLHKHSPGVAAVLLLGAAMATSACLATRSYVETQVGESSMRTDERVEGIETQVEQNQTRIEEQGEQIEANVKRLDEMSDTAREALGRAIAAGELAEGKLIYEAVMTDDQVQFGVDRSELGPEARAMLDDLATRLTEENANIFIEVQGHTDSTGNPEYNLILGERRAAAVRAYLNSQHGVPLHRISVISYGEERPIADNSTVAGRAQNRRVTVVVLK